MPKLTERTTRKEQKAPPGTQLLDKALDLVDMIERSGRRLTANDIAAASGYPKPTVYRILSAMVRRELLVLDRRDQTYELGLRFTELAATFSKSNRIVVVIEEELIRFSARTGETVSVGIPEVDAVRLVSRYKIGLEALPGSVSGAKRPYYASGIGKAVLAWQDEQFVRKYLSQTNLQPFTPNTLCTREQVLDDLRLTRTRGYALDNEELLTGACCVAVPIFAARGELVGAISLSAPSHRLPTQRVNDIVTALKTIVANATERLTQSTMNSAQLPRGYTCLHEGGLFRPAAVADFEDHVVVVDSAAPAIYSFYKGGGLHSNQRLPFCPDAASIGPHGSILLSLQNELFDWNEIALQQRRQFEHSIASLAASPNGREYAASAGPGAILHDALSGQPLFELDISAHAIAVTDELVAVLDSDNSVVQVYDLVNGRLVKRFGYNLAIGRLEAITTDGHCVWLSSSDTWCLEEVNLHTGAARRIVSPERSITAIAIHNRSLTLAGSNLRASLIDKSVCGAGSIYEFIGPDH